MACRTHLTSCHIICFHRLSVCWCLDLCAVSGDLYGRALPSRFQGWLCFWRIACRFFAPDWLGIAQFIGVVLFAGFAAASITLLLQYPLAQTLGITTVFQLLDISRPDYPLLQFFLRNAPGTYQHSLQVANLAEQAAEKIGADPLLTRVGAQFHDIGKALNPTFFIENQVPGNVNTHHDIAPEESAATIIRHVTDGVQLAKKYRLPGRLHDFILEHHGTLITRYQYGQAMEAAGGDVTKVDIEKFRYPVRARTHAKPLC